MIPNSFLPEIARKSHSSSVSESSSRRRSLPQAFLSIAIDPFVWQKFAAAVLRMVIEREVFLLRRIFKVISMYGSSLAWKKENYSILSWTYAKRVIWWLIPIILIWNVRWELRMILINFDHKNSKWECDSACKDKERSALRYPVWFPRRPKIFSWLKLFGIACPKKQIWNPINFKEVLRTCIKPK